MQKVAEIDITATPTPSPPEVLTLLLLLNSLQMQAKLERNLRENEWRFHLLAENATDMITRQTPDGICLYTSPSCKSLLGYTPQECINKNLYKRVHRDDLYRWKKAVMRQQHQPTTIAYRIRHKDGSYRWFESHVRVIREGPQNTAKEIHATSRDITDRVIDKKARVRGQQLAHIFRLNTMEEMASGMAHEITQPLAAVVNYTRGCVRYLQKGQYNTTQLIDAMEKAVAQAERAGEIIQRLKNFFCKGKLVRISTKINSTIRETISFVRNELFNTKTKVHFNLASNLPAVYIDKIQIQQVILNLVQNAMEAMVEHNTSVRKIFIQTRLADKPLIEITVTDTGPGFSKEHINHVFEPFFTTKANGRGMGLAISRSIIEAHGGQFIINPNTQQHSWIRFTLPTQPS